MTKTKTETPDEMNLLLEYLLKTKQTVDFFKSIDLDESNDIDSKNLRS